MNELSTGKLMNRRKGHKYYEKDNYDKHQHEANYLHEFWLFFSWVKKLSFFSPNCKRLAVIYRPTVVCSLKIELYLNLLFLHSLIIVDFNCKLTFEKLPGYFLNSVTFEKQIRYEASFHEIELWSKREFENAFIFQFDSVRFDQFKVDESLTVQLALGFVSLVSWAFVVFFNFAFFWTSILILIVSIVALLVKTSSISTFLDTCFGLRVKKESLFAGTDAINKVKVTDKIA